MICERIIQNWLGEAYEVEQALLDLLDRYGQTIEDEALIERIQHRTEDIQENIDKIMNLSEKFGGDIEARESQIGNLIRDLYNSEESADNSTVRNLRHSIINYGAKYFERAIIRVLLTLGSECEDQRVVEMCKEILSKEEETNEELDQEIIGLSIEHINREVAEKQTIEFTSDEE